MATERRFRQPWAFMAVAVGLLLRLWFVKHHPIFAGDALIYGSIARNLLQHGVYGFNQQISPSGVVTIVPTLIRLPGYPLFLALCFRLFGMENYTAVLYIQLAADLMTCLLVSALATRIFGPRAGLAVLWLASVCPFTANYVAIPITETVVLFTIALTFYALFRWRSHGARSNRWMWVIGCSLSASLLLRPDQGLLAAAVIPAMLWISLRQPGWPRAAAAAVPALTAALCVALPLIPWTARNWRTFHVIQPLAPRSAADPGELPPAGFDLWYRTWAIDFASTDQVYWNANGAHIDPASLPSRAFALRCTAPGDRARETLPLYEPTVALLNDYNQTTTDSAALDVRFAALAQQRRHATPFCTALGLPLARLLNMLIRPRTELLPVRDEWWKAPTPSRVMILCVAYSALDLAYLAVALYGALLWTRYPARSVSRVLFVSMAAAVLLRCALLLTLDNSEPRYTLEFFPIFFVWAGAAVAHHDITRRHRIPTPIA